MAIVMTPIYTQTVGAGGAAAVTFNNIPQIYTDLVLVMSNRSTAAQTFQNVDILVNGVGSGYSATRLGGNGSSAFSDRFTGSSVINLWESAPAANATANTFSNIQVYIPNYTSSNFKQIISDVVAETNATAANQRLFASLWSNTSAITSLTINSYDHAQHSTFSLYGIIRSGA